MENSNLFVEKTLVNDIKKYAYKKNINISDTDRSVPPITLEDIEFSRFFSAL